MWSIRSTSSKMPSKLCQNTDKTLTAAKKQKRTVQETQGYVTWAKNITAVHWATQQLRFTYFSSIVCGSITESILSLNKSYNDNNMMIGRKKKIQKNWNATSANTALCGTYVPLGPVPEATLAGTAAWKGCEYWRQAKGWKWAKVEQLPEVNLTLAEQNDLVMPS